MSPIDVYADVLDRDARELEGARERERAKPEHLSVHVRRTAVHACRQLLAAADAGAPVLSSAILPGNVVRMNRSDDEAVFDYWKIFAVPWLRAARPNAFRGNAGCYDFARPKTDAQGRLLCKDGSLPRIVAVGPDGHETDVTDDDKRAMALREAEGTRLERRGDIARETDDYDNADWLGHYRLVALDWADACRAAAELLRECKAPAPGPAAGQQNSPTATPAGTELPAPGGALAPTVVAGAAFQRLFEKPEMAAAAARLKAWGAALASPEMAPEWAALEAAKQEERRELAEAGFKPPQTLEDWERLARIVEKEPGPMTVGEIYEWAMAWVDREKLRLKLAREVSRTPGDPVDRAAGGKRGTVNQRMLEKLQRNPQSVGRTQRQWAEVLGCSPSAVAKAPAWRNIKTARAIYESERRTRSEG